MIRAFALATLWLSGCSLVLTGEEYLDAGSVCADCDGSTDILDSGTHSDGTDAPDPMDAGCGMSCGDGQNCVDETCVFDCDACPADACHPLVGCKPGCPRDCPLAACSQVDGEYTGECCEDPDSINGNYLPLPGCEDLGPDLDCEDAAPLDCSMPAGERGGCGVGGARLSLIRARQIGNATDFTDVALAPEPRSDGRFRVFAASSAGVRHFDVDAADTVLVRGHPLEGPDTLAVSAEVIDGTIYLATLHDEDIRLSTLTGSAIAEVPLRTVPTGGDVVPSVAIGIGDAMDPALVWMERGGTVHWRGTRDRDFEVTSEALAFESIRASGRIVLTPTHLLDALAVDPAATANEIPATAPGDVLYRLDLRPALDDVHALFGAGDLMGVVPCNFQLGGALSCRDATTSLAERVSMVRVRPAFVEIPLIVTVQRGVEGISDRVVVRSGTRDHTVNLMEPNRTLLGWRQVGESFRVLDVEATLGTFVLFGELSAAMVVLLETESGQRQLWFTGTRGCLE